MTVEIRPYEAGDELAILDLYEEIFDVRQSLAQWRWRFAEVPSGQPSIQVAWERDRVVGQFAYSPMPLALGAASFDALMALDGMVHPEFQRTGLFTRLEQTAAAVVPSESARYGFPNDKSFPLFVGALGWRSPGRPRVLMKLLRTDGLSRRNPLLRLLAPAAGLARRRDAAVRGHVPIRQFSRFAEIEERLPLFASDRVHTRREVVVLDWRYRAGPHPYRLFAFGREGEESGFAVVRIQEKFDLRIAWLADFAVTAADRRHVPTMLRTLASELHADADLFSTLLSHPSEKRQLRRAGFLEAPERLLPHPFFLISHGQSLHQTEFDDLDRWHLTWGLHDAI